jgi:hypothetical protein
MKHLVRLAMFVCLMGVYPYLGAQLIYTSIGDTLINEGDTVVMPVGVENFNGVASISLALNYNPAVVQYIGYQNAHPSLLGGGFVPGGIPPQFKLAWFSLAPVSIGTGTLIELVFFAHSPGFCALDWDTNTPGNCQYSDFNTDLMASSFTSGSITAEPLARGVKGKLVLQSAWTGTQMQTQLNTGGYLPVNQPYNVAPWNYAGTETLDSIPAGMVDWVIVELRDSVDAATVVERRAAILMEDGSILDTDMQNEIAFDSSGMFYVLIDHRNHMPVMSANPRPIPDTTLIDFSTGSAGFYGGTASVFDLGGSVYAMIAGDLNKDGTLKYSGGGNDRSLILLQLNAQTGATIITGTANGYFKEDISMNGQLKYTGAGNDPSRIITNLINLTGSTAINSTFVSPVPQAIIP